MITGIRIQQQSKPSSTSHQKNPHASGKRRGRSRAIVLVVLAIHLAIVRVKIVTFSMNNFSSTVMAFIVSVRRLTAAKDGDLFFLWKDRRKALHSPCLD